jgi:eukaryotic-like serine/threonine-protein kinase
MSTPPEDTPIRIGDRYRLDERIGAGAMGAVWKATDELLNRTVAVKELLAAAVPARGGALEESRQRILREGRIGARLQHPHVISMFDVVVHDDSPWLVMEYLPSQSLAQRLAQDGAIPPREAADIGRQVADGLAAAHKAGVVHRDVKPGNVLLGDDGRVKLTDFGVSRAVDDVQLTRTGLIAGTPAFLSPEVARGQDPTSASDVFALGATLYAAVEGTPPFGLDENAYALLHKVATGEVDPPQQAGPLHDVMMRLLAKEPDDRPTAAEARDLLATVATGAAAVGATPATAVLSGPAARRPSPRPVPAAAPAGPARPPVEERDRRRFPVWLVALLVALLAGGGVLTVLLLNGVIGGGADPGQSAAPTTSEAAAPPPAPASPTEEAEPTPSAAPTVTVAPTTTAPPTTTAAPTTEPPAAEDPVAFVQNYYSLLPGNPEAAAGLLSEQAIAKSSRNGRAGYIAFWNRVESVSLSDVRPTGPNSAAGTVNFVYNDGSPRESTGYSWTMTQDGSGRTIMQTFDQT